MRDDFSALDLLSIGGFRLSAPVWEPVGDHTPRLPTRRRSPSPAARRLAALLPMIGRKFRLQTAPSRSLQGWPVTLSWPAKDHVPVDPWAEHCNQAPL